MVGRTMYGFPGREVFSAIKEDETKKDIEERAYKTLGNGKEFGLTMCLNEQEENKVEKTISVDVHDHVKFLTNDQNKIPGGEEAVFKKNDLIKNPGQFYTFKELCEVEQRLM